MKSLVHFSFSAVADHFGFCEELHCKLTFYIRCVEMLIFYMAGLLHMWTLS